MILWFHVHHSIKKCEGPHQTTRLATFNHLGKAFLDYHARRNTLYFNFRINELYHERFLQTYLRDSEILQNIISTNKIRKINNLNTSRETNQEEERTVNEEVVTTVNNKQHPYLNTKIIKRRKISNSNNNAASDINGDSSDNIIEIDLPAPITSNKLEPDYFPQEHEIRLLFDNVTKAMFTSPGVIAEFISHAWRIYNQLRHNVKLPPSRWSNIAKSELVESLLFKYRGHSMGCMEMANGKNFPIEICMFSELQTNFYFFKVMRELKFCSIR